MGGSRITRHPVLDATAGPEIDFTWSGRKLSAREGEPIAAALLAAGVRVFGHHPKDGAPQGLFCAVGQCAQCLVIADGRPVKSCVTRVRAGQRVEPADGLPALPPATPLPPPRPPETVPTQVLVIGGGPAGMAAALELGRRGVDVLLVDDKPRLGGKLVLQTHRFFGSFNAVYAGSRGIDIAARLAREVHATPGVRVWANSAALAIFSDRRVGVLRDAAGGEGGEYVFVRPEVLFVATGARERFLAFPGNTLPGVLGAGAFQALMHRDLVRPADRVLVVGGGNVGLIAAYHALQAGVEVVAVIEAAPECGGYRVHHDKLARQGVPIHASHTILAALGAEGVEAATIARVDGSFHPVPGTERTIGCDAVLLAVGLDPANELYLKARELGLPAFCAGDADEVSEASAAMFAGRLRALGALHALGASAGPAPPGWHRSLEILRSRPGPLVPPSPAAEEEASGVVPVIHCSQEIPCNPCAAVCPQALIAIDPDDIRRVPTFLSKELGRRCIGCEKCVTICPGQAITLVDYRKDPAHPFVVVPFELDRAELCEGGVVLAVDVDGNVLGEAEIARIRGGIAADRTLAVKLRVPRAWARRVAGFRLHAAPREAPLEQYAALVPGETIACRCERVTADVIRALVRRGVHDINELKVITRVGLGACGARTCGPLVRRLLREEGVADAELCEPQKRPLLLEVSFEALAGMRRDG